MPQLRNLPVGFFKKSTCFTPNQPKPILKLITAYKPLFDAKRFLLDFCSALFGSSSFGSWGDGVWGGVWAGYDCDSGF